MKAVLLAAGKGTRMQRLTAFRPKPMLELCGKPMLEHIIVALRDSGIEEFVLITGYLAEVVESYFQDGKRWGVRIGYVRQPVQNGTGAAFRLAREHVGERPFVAGFGDIIVSLNNYSRLIRSFLQLSCEALISLNWVEDPYQGASVYLDETDAVIDIIEKPPKGSSASHWNNAGLMIFDPLLFAYTAKLKPSPRGEYELTGAIKAMVSDKHRVRGFKLDGFWSDVGRPEDFEAASRAICETGS